MPSIVSRRLRLEDARELERASQAGRLLAAALARLPPAAHEAVEAAAAREADDFVWKLGDLYRVRRWDWAEFRRAYVRGALLAWRPGTELREDDLALRVRSERPLAPEGIRSPEGCRAFLAFQAAVVRLATDGTAGPPVLEECLGRGDRACTLHIPRRAAHRDPVALEAALVRQVKEGPLGRVFRALLWLWDVPAELRKRSGPGEVGP